MEQSEEKLAHEFPANLVIVRPPRESDKEVLGPEEDTSGCAFVVCEPTFGRPLVGFQYHKELLMTCAEHGYIPCTLH